MAISVSFNGENFEQVIYNKEDAFEQLIAQNSQTIFGDKAIYIDTKKKVNTSSLGGTIPDGFLIDLSDSDDPQFYLIEVELQSHDFFKHIFPQITRFFAFYRNSKQRHKLIETLFELLKRDSALTKRLKDAIGAQEIYKFLKDTVDSSQKILIVIDGVKPEFAEITDTYTDTWGKMVKVQIVNHFKRHDNNILTVEPPFSILPFGDAISSSPEKDAGKDSLYTEEFHLENCGSEIKGIYRKLKNEFLKIKNTLEFKPVQQYIGIRDNLWKHPHRNNIAAIFIQRKKLWLFCWLSENEVNKILESHHHNIVVTKACGLESCYVEICDASHWADIQKLVSKLIEKTSGDIKIKRKAV